MERSIAVARCHEIQLTLKQKDVNRFEVIPKLGMAVQLALHLRGLPTVRYEQAQVVAATILMIPGYAFSEIVGILADVEFVRLSQSPTGERTIIPLVPYFDDLYHGLGEYMGSEKKARLGEFESLTLEIVDRLASSPHNSDSLASKIGADRKLFDSSLDIGTKGGFLYKRRARARDIIINPTYFSENAEIYADHVAAVGATSVKRTLALLRSAQGWPLSVIEKSGEINGSKLSQSELGLLRRLAQDGAVKPPSITTNYSGQSHFLFTPTPSTTNISPLKREIYERALAVVSAVRQGQLLPNRYKIHNPAALIYALKTNLQLRPTSDYNQQYQNLINHRIATLEAKPNGFYQLKIIDEPENREALNIAYSLVQGHNPPDIGVDQEAVNAMVGTSDYVESLISSKQMRDRDTVALDEDTQGELDNLLLDIS